MKKMLILQAIDWKWIKQRPQFLAEKLTRYYDVTVAYVYKYSLNRELDKHGVSASGGVRNLST